MCVEFVQPGTDGEVMSEYGRGGVLVQGCFAGSGGEGGAVRLASSMAIRWLVEKERRDFWRLEDCKLEWVRILRSPSLLQPVWAVGT